MALLMATRLRQLLLKEVSLVKRGANRGARILLHKSEDPMPQPNAAASFVDRLRTIFSAAINKTDGDGGELKTPSDQLALVNEELDQLEKELEETPAETTPKPTPSTTLEKTMECTKCGEPIAKNADGEGKEAILKGLPPEALAILKQAEEAAEESRERIEKLEAENEHREALEISKTFLGKIPGDRAAFAEVIKALTPEERTTLEAVLKAANAGMDKVETLTKEIGKTAPPGPDTAKGQIDAAAAEIRKATPGMSVPESIAKAMDANPRLYEESLASK